MSIFHRILEVNKRDEFLIKNAIQITNAFEFKGAYQEYPSAVDAQHLAYDRKIGGNAGL